MLKLKIDIESMPLENNIFTIKEGIKKEDTQSIEDTTTIKEDTPRLAELAHQAIRL